MNLLMLCGSPRKNGNTAAILNQVQSRLAERHSAELCYITDYQINGCMGCNACQSVLEQPGCMQRDQAGILLDKILSADAVLYGTPLYGHSYSGQMKILMDRHVALFKFVGGSDQSVGEMEIISFLKDKPVGLVVSCQGPEEDNTELIQMQFDKFCASSLAVCFGKYIFPWCAPDAKDTDLSEDTIQKMMDDIALLQQR
ncbi:MAG: flavodoxin family protein [Butyricicoccaceae bacterium]